MVLATQNPVEYLGTFALPEAQLDRFFMKLTLGYPQAQEESKILSRFQSSNPLKDLEHISDSDQIVGIQKQVEHVHVEKNLKDFIVAIVRYTREQEEIILGASPRASLSLFRSAQAWALYQGREYVIPDDIIAMAPYILEHRLRIRQEAKLKKVTAAKIIERAIEQVEKPEI